MIVERITLIAIYRALKQLETNEGKLYDIVLNRKTSTSIVSPEAFKDLNALLSFIQKSYPFAVEAKQLEVCHWYPYGVVKFWVEKNNGTLVEFKTELTEKKGSLHNISKKRLVELNTYLNNIQKAINGLVIDPYVAPTTPTYVECVYIDDLVKNDAYTTLMGEYNKYIKP
jgi:hypothetical protein